MLSKEEKKRLLEDLSRLRTDISKLKASLNDKNSEKEAAFAKKEKTTKQITDIIRDVRLLRKERDNLTSKVKSLKKEREDHNAAVIKKIVEHKKLKEEKDKLVKHYSIKGDPSLIQKEIAKLEEKIETDVLSFEKEKKLMKEIKEKKKQFDDAKGLVEVLEKFNKISNEIDEIKKKREHAHKRVQTLADESQKKHEEMVQKSKKIDDLRKEEEEIYKKFFEVKKEYTDINNQLKEKLVEINNLRNKLDMDSKEMKKQKKEKDHKKLMDKAEEVDEKIKKRKKLTTEDLLIFQRTMKDEDDSIEEK